MTRLAGWFLLLLCHAAASWADDYGFVVKRAELVHRGDSYVLNADVNYRFSQAAIDALQHGVPLTLVAHFKIKRQRSYWPDETILSQSRKFRIRYHPLAKSYQLLNEDRGVPQSFAGLYALITAMGEIRGWTVAPVTPLEPGNEYWASLAVNLDIEALPLPLRPVAYVSPSWYLGSPTFRWRVEN